MTEDGAADLHDVGDLPRGDPGDEEIYELLTRAARLHIQRFGLPPTIATSGNVFLQEAERAYTSLYPRPEGREPVEPRPPRRASTRSPQRFVLYRLLGEKDRVLYVGITRNFPARLRAHTRKWGAEIVSTRCEEYDDLESLLEAERAAIRDERPPLNHDGVDEL